MKQEISVLNTVEPGTISVNGRMQVAGKLRWLAGEYLKQELAVYLFTKTGEDPGTGKLTQKPGIKQKLPVLLRCNGADCASLLEEKID